MRQKRQKRRVSQALNTSSLPDIVFMLLFFFVAIGKVPAPLAKIDVTQVVKEGGVDLEDTSRYIHIQIGNQGDELVAQIGYDVIVPVGELTDALKEIRKSEPKRNIVLLYIDDETGMGYLKNEIEPAILESGIKNVNYVLEDEKEVQS